MDCILDRVTAEDAPEAWKAVLSVISEEFASDIGRKERGRNLGSYGSARVPIGGDRTKADGRLRVDSRGQRATRMHLLVARAARV